MARNFISTYGDERFAWLLDQFEKGASGTAIAKELGVTRERVRQWRNAFGTTVHSYFVHVETQRILREESR